jgi:ankyrin repeat protein
VVPENAAKPDYYDSVSLRVNHLDLTRPTSEDDDRFALVLEKIRYLIDKSFASSQPLSDKSVVGPGAALSQTQLYHPDNEAYVAGLRLIDKQLPDLERSKGHEELLNTPIEKEPNVDTEDAGFVTPLEIAAFGGHMIVLQLLIERGADINAQSPKYGGALQAAALAGQERAIQLLRECGADINAQGGEFGSALQAASANGHLRVVRLLLDSGAEVNAQGGAFGSALKAAASKGHTEVVQLLLDKGANVNALSGTSRHVFRPLVKGRYMDSSPKKPYIFTVPFDRDPDFVGRHMNIEELDKYFTNPCRVSLTGLGGVGYSYCSFIRDRYPD